MRGVSIVICSWEHGVQAIHICNSRKRYVYTYMSYESAATVDEHELSEDENLDWSGMWARRTRSLRPEV